MKPVGVNFLQVLLGSGLVLSAYGAESPSTPSPAPDFQEVFSLIREHLEGAEPVELNRDAVEGLLSKLNPRVTLIGGAQSISINEAPLVKTSNLFEGNIAYLRVSRVAEGLPKAIRESCQKVGTNQLTGIVLDLRFASGDDYAAAADTADLFLAKEKPLLDWGKGTVRSKEKTDAIRQPVAILINGETARAAEALAAVLRETGAGLLLGKNSAGQAMIAQEYPLKNGQRLRIATSAIHIGEGAALTTQGVKPDIAVEVNPQDEVAYYADAYRELTRTNTFRSTSTANANLAGTNRVRRPVFNEAELVRQRREGFSTEGEVNSAQADGEIDKPVVRDPVLARALDVLKGLAVVRRAKL